MSKMRQFSLTEVIHRSLAVNSGDVEHLVKYLEMDRSTVSFEKGKRREAAEAIADRLRRMGSNDFATLVRGSGVEYAEIVLDVADKLGVKEAGKGKPVEENEAAILRKLFADALDTMSDAERRQLLSTMGIKEKDIPLGSTGTILVQLLLKNFGGFATYRISLIVANMVARTLLGSGLSFATNIAITRTVGVLLGPVGWAASAAWLLVDLAGPAYRATVPAVVHVAMLRQMLMKRINIGVVGEGSTGKDSLVKAVFGVDTGNVNPVAGSTADTMIYDLGPSGAVHLVNYPGFNDTSSAVNQHVEDMLPYTDVFLMVVDINRGISGLEVATLEKLKQIGRPILVCLNKADLPRPKDREALMEAARERLQGVPALETAFDPDPRLGIDAPLNCRAVHEWVVEKVALDEKETAHIPKSEHV